MKKERADDIVFRRVGGVRLQHDGRNLDVDGPHASISFHSMNHMESFLRKIRVESRGGDGHRRGLGSLARTTTPGTRCSSRSSSPSKPPLLSLQSSGIAGKQERNLDRLGVVAMFGSGSKSEGNAAGGGVWFDMGRWKMPTSRMSLSKGMSSALPWIGYGDGLQRATPRWPLGNVGPVRGGWCRSKSKPRILVLMSDTGGGHRASAEAIRAGFEHLYGSKYHIDIVDLWTHHTPWPYNEFPKSYSFMVKYPFVWRTNFTLTQPRFVHVPLATAMNAVAGPSIAAAFEKYKPNLIISVHPLMQHVPVQVMRRRIESGLQDPNTTFATVVTDLTTCHNTWFYNGVDRCYVATEESKQQALGLGMDEDKLRVYGLPIRPAFSHGLPSKKSLKKRLGLDPAKPCIILMAGGEGMGPLEKTVDAVASQIGADAQLVVVCGRNASLVEKLRSKKYPEGMNVNVQGFVTNMPDFMGACDIIITKAGPGTISEALICGLPLVLNSYIPCQEEGNIPYVTENNVGVFETKPRKVAEIIKSWLENDGKELKALAARAKALAKPDSLFDIVKDLSTMIKPASPGYS